MKAILLATALAIPVATVYAGEGLSLPFLFAHYSALTNTANFHETYSTTNMPPELLQSILRVLGSMGVQDEHRKEMAEPAELLIHGSRLVWAATDTTNWVVHYEFINTGPTATNYCIFASCPSTNPSLQGRNGGYMRSFKNYKEFITYETHLSSR
jgi:hypothetical protein